MKSCLKIRFDRSNSTYIAEETITGHISVQNSQKTQKALENGIVVTWSGKQHVYWETHKPTAAEKRVGPLPKKKLPGDRPCETDTINYFQTTQILTDYVDTKTHSEYPFLFKIPVECVPNVKGKYGGIAYWVTVRFSDSVKEIAKGFNVLPSLDRPFCSNFVNLSPCKLVQGESGAIFKDGSFSMQISLPKRHFIRGETLSTTVTFTNSSTKPITNFTIQLIQRIHYHSNQKLPICQDQTFRNCQLYRNLRRNEKIMTMEQKFPLKIEPGQSFEDQFQFEIPKKSIPTFESPLISVGYFLSFFSKTSSIFSKLQANLGISVGSKPKVAEKLLVPQLEELSCSFSSPPPSYHSDCPSFHEKIE